MSIQFDLPKEQSSIIKVIGVGGGGGNAVNYMFEQGIKGVNFVVCNTDQQALESSPVPNSLQLGPEITQGLGAGSRPDVGEKACLESAEEVEAFLAKNTRMVFITAGMGGGTGTGGAPVIAKIARDMGILTVGIVTTPFSFEGRRKLKQAEEGIRKLKENVDSILVISNDKIREIFGNLAKGDAFGRANDILATAARSISEIITVHGDINVDFADVEYVMKDSGVAIMGNAMAEGEDRAKRAIIDALNSPLLNDNDITGAEHVLINISSAPGSQVTVDEITEIHDFAQEAAGNDTDVIFGTCDDESLGDKIRVTIIATGFERNRAKTTEPETEVIPLDRDRKPPRRDETSTTEWVVREEETPSADRDQKTPPAEDTGGAEDDGLMDFQVRDADNDTPSYDFYTSPTSERPRDETPGEQAMRDRKDRLRRLQYKWGDNIKEMEDEPAYKRRNVDLEEVKPSDRNEISRYTLGGDSDRPELRRNNSFLDDNVD